MIISKISPNTFTSYKTVMNSTNDALAKLPALTASILEIEESDPVFETDEATGEQTAVTRDAKGDMIYEIRRPDGTVQVGNANQRMVFNRDMENVTMDFDLKNEGTKTALYSRLTGNTLLETPVGSLEIKNDGARHYRDSAGQELYVANAINYNA